MCGPAGVGESVLFSTSEICLAGDVIAEKVSDYESDKCEINLESSPIPE